MNPIADRVVVRPKKAETNQNGLFIPESAQPKPLEGEVLAVGPGKADYKMQCKVGDTVLYGAYSGKEFTKDGETLLIMKEPDIFLIL